MTVQSRIRCPVCGSENCTDKLGDCKTGLELAFARRYRICIDCKCIFEPPIGLVRGIPIFVIGLVLSLHFVKRIVFHSTFESLGGVVDTGFWCLGIIGGIYLCRNAVEKMIYYGRRGVIKDFADKL